MTGSFNRLLNASKEEPPTTISCFLIASLDLKWYEKNIAISKNKTEKIINEKGPHSEIELEPQSSVEKYLAIEDPKNAPKEPPALIIPNNLFASSFLKKLIIATQKTDTTKKL
jgi:hypothetical protein